ncbi:hypothetical protein KI387_035378, partial [Taxus chinensis]
MRLLLLQLRKNGLETSRFHGPKSTLDAFRQYPYAFSRRETLSTASNSSKHQGSGSGKSSPSSGQSVGSQGSAQSGGSQGSAPPGGSPGSRNQALKLVLGSAAVVAAITTAFYPEWPRRILPGGSKKEHAPLLNNEIKQSDMKSSEVVNNAHLKDEDSAHRKEALSSSNFGQDKEQITEEEMKQSNESDETLTSSNLSQEKEQVIKEEMKQSDTSDEAHPRQDELEDMQQENTTPDSEVHKDHEVNSTVENVLPSLKDDTQEVEGTDSLNTIKNDAASDDTSSQYKSPLEDVFHIKGSEYIDVKEVEENKDGKQESAGDSDISEEPYQDIVASKSPEKGGELQDKRPSDTLSDSNILRKENEHASQRLSNEDGRDSISVSKQKEDAQKGRADTKELDGVLVLDFIQAIHAAEQRQAELDAHIYNEFKRTLKEKYEKDLKDARARELMYAEEADSLEK